MTSPVSEHQPTGPQPRPYDGPTGTGCTDATGRTPAAPSTSRRLGIGSLLARRTGLAVVATIVIVSAVVLVIPAPIDGAAAAEGPPTVVIEGRGWGHGRGMGQYGALGYATDHGWSSDQILNHYYGGTTSGQAPIPGAVDPRQVRVDLVFMRGRPTTVGLDNGAIHLMSSDGASLLRVSGAVRLTADGSSMSVATAPNCSGPWTTQTSFDRTLVRLQSESADQGQAGLLHACGPSYRTWYDGELWGTNSGGRQHTINVVSVEEYLRGVVPNEVPASWVQAALEAQAVAARSYVLAGDTRWTGYADTCDTTTCQVYDGRFTTRGAGLRISTHPRTDEAIAATNGIVRLRSSGAVARTEFSSSTGGHTAGGDFPAVTDEGDRVAANPNAQWRVAVDLRSLENAYGKGSITGIAVVDRNGLGPDGGRAVTVEYTFTGGSVTVDGDQARRHFGLKSNWFSFGPLVRAGVVVDDPAGPAAIARFVEKAYQRLEGRSPSSEESSRWRERLKTEPRVALTTELAHSPHFAGVLIDDLYRSALGRPADGDGRRYWVETMANGLRYEQLGTLFHGSPEYVQRAGGNDEGFVGSLYRGILGREPDPDGQRYWLDQMAGGRAGPADVANAFYQSVESRRDRAASVHRRVMASEPTAQQVEEGAERLLSADDLTLAAEVATALGQVAA